MKIVDDAFEYLDAFQSDANITALAPARVSGVSGALRERPAIQ